MQEIHWKTLTMTTPSTQKLIKSRVLISSIVRKLWHSFRDIELKYFVNSKVSNRILTCHYETPFQEGFNPSPMYLVIFIELTKNDKLNLRLGREKKRWTILKSKIINPFNIKGRHDN